MTRRRLPPLSVPQPPAEPARFTVQVINEALGHVSRCGFPTLEKATDYARTQASRSQRFMLYRVLSGAPKDFGAAVGVEFRGTPRT